ncbi:MAG: ferredoxin oxidoreductase [Gammaproteobacteria bacterium CG22_combo_CG10-13_8_21_14_all_40_8]|nr:MAG: ferredoxin oxidoreductase [Gammaproteobacteria bacterium CG22_combo_CG10-13_8_21_14_all_40_8]
MHKITSVNDFVIRFANVNGSGSASANNLFAKSVFRLGIPVSPKNIFPSNIQGLPTWYEVRVNEHGYLGRRGGVDFMVATNGQTLKQDYDEVLPGGYFFYDSTKNLPHGFERKDITEIGLPLTAITNTEYSDPRQRQLFKNIIYVGALAYLFSMDFSVFTDSIKQQFSKKPKLIEPNIHALELGYNYAKEHHTDACAISIERRNNVGDSILMDGNSAVALGAVYSGATVVGWYPITPSTSVVEAFEKYATKFRMDKETGKKNFAIMQAEDELAAIGMVAGATWNGARAFTATSGPGLSLMNEFIGLAYFSELPIVLVDIQRSGPSTGMPTRTQQSDLILAAYASHGDTKHVLLFPCDPRECFEMGADAFDLADRLQTPVMVMSDLDLGMNDNMSPPLKWDDERRYDRGKVLTAEDLDNAKQAWGRYLDVDGDGIPYRTYPGTHPTKGSYFTRGSSHDEYARYTEDGDTYAKGMQRLLVKWETAKTLVPTPHTRLRSEKSRWGAIFFGTSTHASYEAISSLNKQGVAIDSMRIRAFPFQKEVKSFIDNYEMVFVIEQNRDGQMRTLLINECGIVPQKLVSVLNIDGMPITARFIAKRISQVLSNENVVSLQTAETEE